MIALIRRHLPFVILISLAGCVPHVEEPLTQLQVREIQTREFGTKDTRLVIKSMMDVLQDEGFIIKNVVEGVGLLSAEKIVDIDNRLTAFMMYSMDGPNARWPKQQILEASANVSEFGDKTRVRINFQMKTIDNFGCPQSVTAICDPCYYQDFFEKVSKGIFIQEQDI